jgi:predicted deacylase
VRRVRDAADLERVALDSGPEARAEMVVLHGSGAGPTVSILGGVHGDEPEGSLAIEALLAAVDPSAVKGTIRAVPVCNPAAANADSRVNPVDGLNLAREFPGAAGGRPTQRLAHLIAQNAIAGSDLLVDLHSAGRDYVMPFFSGFDATQPWAAASAKAARAFGAPLIWEHNAVAPGRTISTASELGLPSMYVEAAGGGTVSGETIDALLGGLKRVLAAFGLIQFSGAEQAPRRVLRGGDGNVDESIRCATAGLCVTRIAAGSVAEAGAPLADIYVRGVVAEHVRAPRAGAVMMLRRNPRVEAGQAIAMLGPVPVASG